LGYQLDLTWVDGYTGFIRNKGGKIYTEEDDGGFKIGPPRFEFELNGFSYDFDALDEFAELDDNIDITVAGVKFKIASIGVLKECFRRELKCGWGSKKEEQKLELLMKLENEINL